MSIDITRLTVGKEDILKQSSYKKQREETAALLLRISRDDGEVGESNSIQNQRKLLTKAAKEMGYTNLLEFPDDGVSGTTMNRPGFKATIRLCILSVCSQLCLLVIRQNRASDI